MRTWKILLALSLVITANMACIAIDGTQVTAVQAEMPDDSEELSNITVGELKDIFVWFWIDYMSTHMSDIETSLDDIEDGAADFDGMLNEILANQSAILENQTQLSEDINQSYNDIEDRIDAAIISINDNTSLFIFGTTNISDNTSLSSELEQMLNVSQMNLSVSVDDVSFEGLNESTIISKLNSIRDMIGYGNTSSSIYTDMGYAINALYDKNNNPILKNEDGTSSFEVMASFLINAFEDSTQNQQTLLNSTVMQGNATRNLVREESSDIQSRISSEATAVVDAVGGPWALIAALILILFTLYIIILWMKPGFLPNILPGAQPQPQQAAPAQDQYYEEEPPQQMGPERNLFGGMKKAQGPPPCYKDGVTYDLMQNPNCATCPYKNECAQAKIGRTAQTQDEMMGQIKQEEEPEEADFNDLEDW